MKNNTRDGDKVNKSARYKRDDVKTVGYHRATRTLTAEMNDGKIFVLAITRPTMHDELCTAWETEARRSEKIKAAWRRGESNPRPKTRP